MELRAPTADEHAYLRECALKVLQPPGVRWREWAELRRPVVERWIADPGTRVLVDDGMVLGFALTMLDVLAVLYVRKRAHGYGLGARLLAAAGQRQRGQGIGPWSDLARTGAAL
jgi:GNAT superfamily N-acetyltransferase